eukprot:gene3537-13605_t
MGGGSGVKASGSILIALCLRGLCNPRGTRLRLLRAQPSSNNTAPTLTAGYRTMARAVRLGYNVLCSDTDVIFFDDPYRYLKRPPFKDYVIINQAEALYSMDEYQHVTQPNGGIVYVQGKFDLAVSIQLPVGIRPGSFHPAPRVPGGIRPGSFHPAPSWNSTWQFPSSSQSPWWNSTRQFPSSSQLEFHLAVSIQPQEKFDLAVFILLRGGAFDLAVSIQLPGGIRPGSFHPAPRGHSTRQFPSISQGAFDLAFSIQLPGGIQPGNYHPAPRRNLTWQFPSSSQSPWWNSTWQFPSSSQLKFDLAVSIQPQEKFDLAVFILLPGGAFDLAVSIQLPESQVEFDLAVSIQPQEKFDLAVSIHLLGGI